MLGSGPGQAAGQCGWSSRQATGTKDWQEGRPAAVCACVGLLSRIPETSEEAVQPSRQKTAAQVRWWWIRELSGMLLART